MVRGVAFTFLGLALLCAPVDVQAEAATSALAGVAPDAATGLRVPKDFTITSYATGVGSIRHMAASESGWLYGALSKPVNRMGAVALFDADGDGVAEERHYFADRIRGMGIGIYGGYLYYGTNVSIIRWKLPEAGGVPAADPELVAHGFNYKRQHASKTFTFDEEGSLYVGVGAPSNACMKNDRTAGSPGMDPCPILDEFGGIWKFEADSLMQHQTETATLYATGIRYATALDWNPYANSLYLLQHGRDQLSKLFPDFYSLQDNADLPAEEFHRVEEGADLGWPYSYYDQIKGKRMLMPEYGGDGKTVSEKGQAPIIGFPGHWSPIDLLFKRRGGMPSIYNQGAFIAFQGSWARSPLPEEGYQVVFVPMDADGNPSGDWTIFMDGFTGTDMLSSPRDARHRPAGLAEGLDGSLFVSSSVNGGHIWQVRYKGTSAVSATSR